MQIWSNNRKSLGKGNATDQVQVEVRKALEKFQEGYKKRDVTLIDSYMKE